MSENEPSAQTKALLERTRAAKAKQSEVTPTATVIEDVPIQKKATQPDQPPQADIPVIRDNETPVSNDDLKAPTRTTSRTQAEQERGRQIIEKNQQARLRAQAAQKASDKQ